MSVLDLKRTKADFLKKKGFVLPDLFFFMECGICNAIKKWFTKKDDMTDKSDRLKRD